MKLYVQYGCGLCAPKEWANFDVSPSLRIQRLPIIGKLVPGGRFGRFPETVQYGDVRRGLPVAANSADGAYCSHTLEHLSLVDFRTALKETFRVLKPGGIFRFVLPNMRQLAADYMESTKPTACTDFVAAILMGDEQRPRGIKGLAKEVLGNTRHRWMWDEPSLTAELVAAGFHRVRRARRGDSGDAQFDLVEEEHRWDRLAIGMEAFKP